MPEEKKERGLHELFEIGVLLKGINAVLELLFGSLLLFVDVQAIVEALIQNEIIEDPNDFLATHLHSIAGHITPGAEVFSGLYLIAHGVIKIVLVYGLLKNKIWAYPASLTVLALFVAYQGITWVRTHSIALLLLTIFDLSLIALIYHEYRARVRKAGIQ